MNTQGKYSSQRQVYGYQMVYGNVRSPSLFVRLQAYPQVRRFFIFGICAILVSLLGSAIYEWKSGQIHGLAQSALESSFNQLSEKAQNPAYVRISMNIGRHDLCFRLVGELGCESTKWQLLEGIDNNFKNRYRLGGILCMLAQEKCAVSTQILARQICNQHELCSVEVKVTGHIGVGKSVDSKRELNLNFKAQTIVESTMPSGISMFSSYAN